ncbi:stonustoxin subunit alpha-like [Leucoraja erinacea]|uniref:stonustoxin subunit alpha-like n=1 Tax=Leucoraja erinaceus TaxID=7782 RepID=UPI0024559D50|nr:stonustoxin subunit alpha-like [Leucoraja erinacea]XP_055486237.1 stonustoxin subunit alpha-like [Leucoraja erinacea]
MSETLQLAALGRPFQLGMLYDCRSDTLIQGVTLWDLQTLQSNLDRRDQPSTEFHIIASDSMESKSAALNVSASLKASILGGLVEVKGSAKYLSNTKESKQQARVTLQYKATTRFEQLTMSHLGRQNITYPSVFDEGSATHVITAVLYGAQAFFVFDQMASSAEKIQDIQGNMEATINLLPQIAIQGEASLEMTEEQKSHAEEFSCKFHGDFSLKNNPTTFKEAINIYATLPHLLGPDGEHSVPITVWLYPLNKLDSKAAQLVREISVGLVSRCQDVLEQLNEAVMRCNDLMKDSVAVQFPEIINIILRFQKMCLEYKLVFQGTLCKVLPSIRGGGAEEVLLADILKNREQSPFKHQALTTWLDDKAREMKVVGRYLRILKDIPVVKSESELDDMLMDLATVYVVCFTFTTLHNEDLYLSEANNYLQSPTAQKMETQPPADGACTQRQRQHNSSFNLPSVSRKMRELSGSFLDFATANEADRKIKFAVGSVRDDSNIGASIYLYDGGCLENRCFVPPSQPKIPTSSRTTHDSVTLQLQPPTFGADEIVGYKVEYRGSQQAEWTILDTPDQCHSFTIPGLQPHQEYHFRYRAVTKVGVSKASESYRGITRPASPPGKPVFQDCSSSPTLHWDRPGQIGADVNIFRYRIEYREEPSDNLYMKGGLWEEVKTTDTQCHYCLEGLKHTTVYRVRVSADCGETGSSEASEEVSIKIGNAPITIARKHRTDTQLISKGNPSIYKLKLQEEIADKVKQLVKCSFGKHTNAHK